MYFRHSPMNLKNLLENSWWPWLLITLCTAAFAPITDDEALYYMYGLHLDWGFHDHPPLVALFTSPGNLAASTLAVRFFTVLASTLSLWIGVHIVKERTGDHRLFQVFWWMLPILHVYSFIVTPDVPLLFFTMLLWWVLHKWMQSNDDRYAWWLVPVLAGLMYAKYHAAILLIIALLPMRRFWRPTPLLATLGAVLLFLPHLWWQYLNEFDTWRYHFIDRSGAFAPMNLLAFAGAQIALFHPYLWWRFFKRKAPENEWQRLHLRVFVGLIVFFLLMTFRGRSEAHWAAAGAFSLLFLISRTSFNSRALTYWGAGTIALLLIGRLLFIVDTPLNAHARNEEKLMHDLHAVAGDRPVAFMNSYPRPSLYHFYTGGTAHNVANMHGGMTQYQLWHYDTALSTQPFFWMASYERHSFDTLTLGGKLRRVKWIEDYQPLEKLWVHFAQGTYTVKQGTFEVEIDLENKSLLPLDLAAANDLRVDFFMNHKKPEEYITQIECVDWPDQLAPGERIPAKVRITLPDTTGDFWFKIGVEQRGWPHSINSHRTFLEIR